MPIEQGFDVYLVRQRWAAELSENLHVPASARGSARSQQGSVKGASRAIANCPQSPSTTVYQHAKVGATRGPVILTVVGAFRRPESVERTYLRGSLARSSTRLRVRGTYRNDHVSPWHRHLKRWPSRHFCCVLDRRSRQCKHRA